MNELLSVVVSHGTIFSAVFAFILLIISCLYKYSDVIKMFIESFKLRKHNNDNVLSEEFIEKKFKTIERQIHNISKNITTLHGQSSNNIQKYILDIQEHIRQSFSDFKEIITKNYKCYYEHVDKIVSNLHKLDELQKDLNNIVSQARKESEYDVVNANNMSRLLTMLEKISDKLVEISTGLQYISDRKVNF